MEGGRVTAAWMSRFGALWLAALLAFGAVEASAASAPLPAPASYLIVLGRSIGGVKLGQQLSSAKKQWGKANDCSYTATLHQTACVYGNNQAQAGFYALRGKVVTVYITANCGGPLFFGPISASVTSCKARQDLHRFSTSLGIRVGSTSNEVMRAYPRADHNKNDIVIGRGAHTTQFSIKDGLVFNVQIGAA